MDSTSKIQPPATPKHVIEPGSIASDESKIKDISKRDLKRETVESTGLEDRHITAIKKQKESELPEIEEDIIYSEYPNAPDSLKEFIARADEIREHYLEKASEKVKEQFEKEQAKMTESEKKEQYKKVIDEITWRDIGGEEPDNIPSDLE